MKGPPGLSIIHRDPEIQILVEAAVQQVGVAAVDVVAAAVNQIISYWH